MVGLSKWRRVDWIAYWMGYILPWSDGHSNEVVMRRLGQLLDIGYLLILIVPWSDYRSGYMSIRLVNGYWILILIVPWSVSKWLQVDLDWLAIGYILHIRTIDVATGRSYCNGDYRSCYMLIKFVIGYSILIYSHCAMVGLSKWLQVDLNLLLDTYLLPY